MSPEGTILGPKIIYRIISAQTTSAHINNNNFSTLMVIRHKCPLLQQTGPPSRPYSDSEQSASSFARENSFQVFLLSEFEFSFACVAYLIFRVKCEQALNMLHVVSWLNWGGDCPVDDDTDTLKTILKSGRKPTKMWVDKGKEFFNKHCRRQLTCTPQKMRIIFT